MSGTSQPTSTALLEELRQRIRSEYAPPEPTSAERLATFGRGVLSNRGSFLDNLTAGIAAQDQAAEARANRQRLALDMERQVVENAIREETERNRLEENRRQFEAEGPGREARTGLYRAQAAQANRPSYNVIGVSREGWAVIPDPNSPTGTRTLEGVTPTQVAGLNARAESTLRQAATTEAGRRAREEFTAAGRMFDSVPREERDRRIREIERDILLNYGLSPIPGSPLSGAAAPPPPAPAAVIDLQARPTR